MNLSHARDLIEHFEGCVLHAYRDSVGVPTIGYGTTHGVAMGMVCTKEQALQWLDRDMGECAARIATFVHVPLNDGELSALVSLAYNIGVYGLEKSSVLKLLNSGADKRHVADQFMLYVHAGGRVLQGLVNRRREERLVFLS